MTGSFAAAIAYDKYQTKRIRQKWCDLVAPLAEETLPPSVLPRRITVYIEAPPADGLRAAREHFHEYIKPVLVAAAMDWDVVEGRREGDVRYGTAERIRRFRRQSGDGVIEEEDMDAKASVDQIREKVGNQQEPGPAGDMVIGRHTWKEYIRGLHEGWLGPPNKPTLPETEAITSDGPVEDAQPEHAPGHASLGDAAVTTAASLVSPTLSTSSDSSPAVADDASPVTSDLPEQSTPEAPKEEKKDDKPKRPTKPEPYISTSAYASAQSSPSLPNELPPTALVPFPHILGFWNFPIRLWRFMNRRELAEDVGRRTAAIVMASSRPFQSPAEQEAALAHEEPEWHKSVKKRERAEGEESVWLDDMVIDERIGDRMRLFDLTQEDEARAEQLMQEPRAATKDDE